MRHAPLAVVLCAALLAGCGGGDDDAASPSAAATKQAVADTVRIEDFVFEPATVTVRAGERITLVNGDAAPHTLTEVRAGGSPRFDTGNVRGRRDGSFRAPGPGTYRYFCELHAFMKGELVVVS